MIKGERIKELSIELADLTLEATKDLSNIDDPEYELRSLKRFVRSKIIMTEMEIIMATPIPNYIKGGRVPCNAIVGETGNELVVFPNGYTREL